jgi:anti-anti-sigma factor
MLTQSIGRYTPRIFSGGDIPMRGSDLQVHFKPSPDALVVALVGEAHFDFDAAEAHIQKILSLHPRHVIVDATGLSFISSVGMCFLINLRRALQRQEIPLKIAGLQPLVQNALQRARIAGLFDLSPDVASARTLNS